MIRELYKFALDSDRSTDRAFKLTVLAILLPVVCVVVVADKFERMVRE